VTSQSNAGCNCGSTVQTCRPWHISPSSNLHTHRRMCSMLCSCRLFINGLTGSNSAGPRINIPSSARHVQASWVVEALSAYCSTCPPLLRAVKLYVTQIFSCNHPVSSYYYCPLRITASGDTPFVFGRTAADADCPPHTTCCDHHDLHNDVKGLMQAVLQSQSSSTSVQMLSNTGLRSVFEDLTSYVQTNKINQLV